MLTLSLLPWLVLSLRQSIRAAAESDAVVGARARGIPEPVIVRRHILPVALGPFTPPLAVNLMVSCRIANVRMEETVRWVVWMLGAMFVVMVAVIAFPELALWLPLKLGY